MRLTVGKKLLGLAVISAALTLAVGIAGYRGLRGMAGATEDMLRVDARIGQNAARVRANTLGLRRFEKDVFINVNDPKKVEEYEKKFAETREHLQQRLEALKSVAVLQKDKDRTSQMIADLAAYQVGMGKVVARIKAGEIKTAHEANAAIGEVKAEVHRLEKTAEDFSKEAFVRMDEVEGELNGKARSATTTMLLFVLLSIAIGAGVSFVIARAVAVPLRRMVDMLKDIAEGEGDLTKRLEVTSRDEVGETARWFNVFVGKIHDVIAQVKDSAAGTASASQQLSSAASQLSTGAQEQASSLEETAASLEEITATVKQNAENARQADQLAAGSRDAAEKGGTVVRAAVAAMSEINESSKKIAEIITTIDEIAFQTNLLALNAAVEAARAGEQGRGFAVVAAEVRNLAQRSAQAAREIKALIQDSVHKVEDGAGLVNQSGQTLEEIMTSVKRVTDLIGEIAAASQEQSTGIDQVNKAVTQMDQVTQANASQTEELASTAHSMAGQARNLEEMVGRFKLNVTRMLEEHAPVGPSESRRPAPKPMAIVGQPRRSMREELVPVGAHARNGSAKARDDEFEEF